MASVVLPRVSPISPFKLHDSLVYVNLSDDAEEKPSRPRCFHNANRAFFEGPTFLAVATTCLLVIFCRLLTVKNKQVRNSLVLYESSPVYDEAFSPRLSMGDAPPPYLISMTEASRADCSSIPPPGYTLAPRREPLSLGGFCCLAKIVFILCVMLLLYLIPFVPYIYLSAFGQYHPHNV
ncbi:hypothetical protein QR680_016741 [Steinernema hermaphroditum]|uniref:Uncharacterized protein n=1 Tax=Steinernema hermaphroditum TaxID=289476 RepID=A0AA39HCK8_9BILA|nr:hypothetical protein QR680_016741 [Steinernema hermaphroditum]